MHDRIIIALWSVVLLSLTGLPCCKQTRVKQTGGKQTSQKPSTPASPSADEQKPGVQDHAHREDQRQSPEPKVVPPPRNNKTKAERYKEPQPGVLTRDQLTHMLTNARDMWMRPDLVVKELAIKPGSVVADVGCGSGYWTFRLSKAVGPEGRVLAVDFDLNAIKYMKERVAKEKARNIKLVLSKSFDTLLKPGSIDLALLVNVHFLKQPNEPEDSQVSEDFPSFYKSIHRALRPGGRMAMVEPDKDTKSSRHVDTAEIARQMGQVGFRLKKRYDVLKGNYFMVFVKK